MSCLSLQELSRETRNEWGLPVSDDCRPWSENMIPGADRPMPRIHSVPKVQRPLAAKIMWIVIVLIALAITVTVSIPVTRWMAHQVITHEVRP